MRKKQCLTLLIFLAIIIIFPPLVTGFLFKAKYFHFVEIINHEQHIKVDILSYQQGWLYSYAKIRVTFIDELPQSAETAPRHHPLSFILDEKISHGPIVYDDIKKKFEFGYANIRNELHLSGELQTPILGNLTSMGIMKVNTLAKFDGDWYGDIEIPTLSFAIDNLGSMVWYGLTGDFKLLIHRERIKNIKFEIQLGSITIKSNAKNSEITEMDIQPIFYRYEITHEKSGLWSGNATLYTPGFTIRTVKNQNLIVNKLAINSAFSMDENTIYNSSLAIYINDLKPPIQTLPEIIKLNISLSINNLSAKEMNKYINYISYNTQNAVKDMDFKTIETLVAHAILPTTVLYSDISTNSSLGLFSSQSTTKWQPNQTGPNTFTDLFTEAVTNANITSSATFLQKIIEIYDEITNAPTNPNVNSLSKTKTPQEVFDDMLLGGFINKNESNYATILTVEGDMLKLNGRPITSSPPPSAPTKINKIPSPSN